MRFFSFLFLFCSPEWVRFCLCHKKSSSIFLILSIWDSSLISNSEIFKHELSTKLNWILIEKWMLEKFFKMKIYSHIKSNYLHFSTLTFKLCAMFTPLRIAFWDGKEIVIYAFFLHKLSNHFSKWISLLLLHHFPEMNKLKYFPTTFFHRKFSQPSIPSFLRAFTHFSHETRQKIYVFKSHTLHVLSSSSWTYPKNRIIAFFYRPDYENE